MHHLLMDKQWTILRSLINGEKIDKTIPEMRDLVTRRIGKCSADQTIREWLKANDIQYLRARPSNNGLSGGTWLMREMSKLVDWAESKGYRSVRQEQREARSDAVRDHQE